MMTNEGYPSATALERHSRHYLSQNPAQGWWKVKTD